MNATMTQPAAPDLRWRRDAIIVATLLDVGVYRLLRRAVRSLHRR